MLIAGEIGKPHGVSGEVYVVRISDDPRRFDAGATLVHEDGRRLVVEASRSHRDRLLVKFAEAHDRDTAEGLRGVVYVPASKARPLDDDEFWDHDIEGCEVFDASGERVGRVAKVVHGPAQDLLEVDTGAGPRLIPFVDEFLVSVDVEARRITMDPPEGLI